MGSGEKMEKIDMEKELPKLNQVQQDSIRKVETINLERVKRLQKIRRRNIGTGIAIASGVLGIYLYTMFAVKQEKFLDFEEMPKENKS